MNRAIFAAVSAGILVPIVLSTVLAGNTKAVTPTLISKAQLEGAIFEDYDTVMKSDGQGLAWDVEAFLSSDRHFDAGVYRAGRSRFEIDKPYGVNEYMHFIEGGAKLISTDGTIVEVNAGDSVMIPAEWTGIWETDGYTKIYVIYSPEAPIE